MATSSAHVPRPSCQTPGSSARRARSLGATLRARGGIARAERLPSATMATLSPSIAIGLPPSLTRYTFTAYASPALTADGFTSKSTRPGTSGARFTPRPLGSKPGTSGVVGFRLSTTVVPSTNGRPAGGGAAGAVAAAAGAVAAGEGAGRRGRRAGAGEAGVSGDGSGVGSRDGEAEGLGSGMARVVGGGVAWATVGRGAAGG